jgi:hypothetical protein
MVKDTRKDSRSYIRRNFLRGNMFNGDNAPTDYNITSIVDEEHKHAKYPRYGHAELAFGYRR